MSQPPVPPFPLLLFQLEISIKTDLMLSWGFLIESPSSHFYASELPSTEAHSQTRQQIWFLVRQERTLAMANNHREIIDKFYSNPI